MKSILGIVVGFALVCSPALGQHRHHKQGERFRPGQGSADALPGSDQPEAPKKEEPADPTALTTAKFGALKARGGIGGAQMSGRVSDIAVNPGKRSEWYVGVASGGLWKTVNGGVTFSPIFDSYGSYSIGCVTIDPGNDSVIWVGTGENNSQRSVAWGDGVYVSRDGGKSFANVGLKNSGSIGMIRVDPRNSSVVYAAAFGPLWSDGGDRGLYKTIDGGATWERILDLGEQTGVGEVHLDPRDPEVVYATAYQRRRHVWTLINGGPNGGLHKSTNGGKTWKKLTSGMPTGDLGRIGLAVSPADPDVVYAIVEAQGDKSGVYRSVDRGESFEKRSGYVSSSPQYYQELVADPKNVDRLYALDTFLHTTDDGGKTMRRVEHKSVHVDWHALVIDPQNTDHLLGGNDGGIYETWDRANWRFFPNLPLKQYYRVAVDNSEPFYFVYGGTQDNNTHGGPSRTTDMAGITNADWFVTASGDGFEPAVDPLDPNIVYSQWQDGGLVRFDRRSGEQVDIRPIEKRDDPAFVFNWDAALIISPHSHSRLYYAGNVLHRSDDRGDSWRRVSGDLTRGLDRNALKVMGVIQKPEAVAKHRSTSIYGSGVSLSESPLKEGLLYVGTDDGLINVTEDGGQAWRKVEALPGVAESAMVDGKQLTLISDVEASRHAAGRVYATADNHKFGDYAAYVFRSDDMGATWKSITGDLPTGTAYSIVEDHVNPDLLFVGTEFGVHFTLDGGTRWFKVAGIPTIDCRDLEIQRRENDLVVATFGRGFSILDDYTPLRTASSEVFAKEAHIFPIRAALSYVPRSRIGGSDGRGWSGADLYAAANPPFGAMVTYHLKEKLMSRKERRQEAEKKEGWTHATIEELQAEDREQAPKVVLVVRDGAGGVLRQIDASREAGMHRMAWNLRLPLTTPVQLVSRQLDPWETDQDGPLVPPGMYTVQLAKVVDGVTTMLDAPVPVEVRDLDQATLAAKGPARAEKFAFERRLGDLQRATEGASSVLGEVASRLNHLRKGTAQTPGVDPAVSVELEALRTRHGAIQRALGGDGTLADRMVAQAPSIRERVGNAMYSTLNSTQPPTGTQKEQYEIAAERFENVLSETRSLVADLQALEARLEGQRVPWTPGRIPEWKRGG
ncbi:MAG: glycosyl hydrolase [Phycisphaerales bacterium]